MIYGYFQDKADKKGKLKNIFKLILILNKNIIEYDL